MILTILERRFYQPGQQDTFNAKHYQDAETTFKESLDPVSSYTEANIWSIPCYHGTVFAISGCFIQYFITN